MMVTTQQLTEPKIQKENLLEQGSAHLQQQEFLSSGNETVNLTAAAIPKS